MLIWMQDRKQLKQVVFCEIQNSCLFPPVLQDEKEDKTEKMDTIPVPDEKKGR